MLYFPLLGLRGPYLLIFFKSFKSPEKGLLQESLEFERGAYMGSCNNYGPFLGTLNNRCRIIIGTPKREHNFDNHPYGFERLLQG